MSKTEVFQQAYDDAHNRLGQTALPKCLDCTTSKLMIHDAVKAVARGEADVEICEVGLTEAFERCRGALRQVFAGNGILEDAEQIVCQKDGAACSMGASLPGVGLEIV